MAGSENYIQNHLGGPFSQRRVLGPAAVGLTAVGGWRSQNFVPLRIEAGPAAVGELEDRFARGWRQKPFLPQT